MRRVITPSKGETIRKAASVRVLPATMTALAAFFAMIPTALALERGSGANAPLARAILGGLIAGEPAILFFLPALYSLVVRGSLNTPAASEPGDHPERDGPAEPTDGIAKGGGPDDPSSL